MQGKQVSISQKGCFKTRWLLLDHLRFIFKPHSLIYMLIASLWISPPLLTAAKTSYLGVSCGCSLLREGADWRLPGTTATPLRAHALSFRLQHVYRLPPLLLFRGHISMCVYKSVNKYMCQTVNHLYTRRVIPRKTPEGLHIFLKAEPMKHQSSVTSHPRRSNIMKHTDSVHSVTLTLVLARSDILHGTCLHSTLRKQEKREREGERNKQEEEAKGGPEVGEVGGRAALVQQSL